MKATREDLFIKLFLSVYEDGAWASADLRKPDALDRVNPAVDQIATRKSDGKTVAVEHTIIEPFVGEKEDLAFFETAFLKLQDDKCLPVPGRWIQVFVPVGTLRNQPKTARVAIVESVHQWIRSNRCLLADGASQLECQIEGAPAAQPLLLNVKVEPLAGDPQLEPGILHVRRQQVEDTLHKVIEKALTKKLPKLTNTKADKRILMLERQHPNLYQRDILAEIQRQKPLFPELAHVDEIWILETIFYGTAFGGDYLRFERYEKESLVRSFDFRHGRLKTKSVDGVGEVIREN